MIFSIGGNSKMKPATAINSNVWYHITEGRVDKAGRRFSSMLQVDSSSNSLKVWPVSNPPYYWQFQAVGSSDQAQYVVRNSRDGVAKQLSACRNDTEPADGQTGVCMAPANGADEAQVWRIDQWGGDMIKDGLRFVNVANGTRFWLDVHRGNPPFMNSNNTSGGEDKEEDDDEDVKGEPSQHWYITSAQAVNAIEYSTIQTISSTSTSTTDPAATISDSAATASAAVDASSSTNTGLSGGAQAGIGIGVALGAIALGVVALLLWRRRRRTQPDATDITTTTAAATAAVPPGTPNTNKPLPPIGATAGDGDDDDEKKVYELPDTDPSGSYYNLPQELPTPTGPLSPLMAREFEAQRYELDSTPVSR